MKNFNKNKYFDIVYRFVFGDEITSGLSIFFKNFFYIVVGYGIAGIFIFGFEIIAGRILGPGEYGKYVLADSLGLFLYLLMTLGLNTAIVHNLAKTDDFKKQQITISSAYLIFFMLVLIIGFFGSIFFWPFLDKALNIPIKIFQMAIIFAASYSFFTFTTDVLRGLYQMKKLAIFRLLYGLLVVSALFIFILYGNQIYFEDAIYSLCFSNIFVSLIIMGIFLRKFFVFKIDWVLIKIMLQYGINVMVGVAFFTFLPIFSKLLINKFLSAQEVGIYNVYYFSSINIMAFLYNIFITVFFPVASKYQDKKPIFTKIKKVLPFLIFGGFALLLTTQFLTFQFYGTQYPYNYYLASLFSVAGILMAIYSVYSWTFYSAGTSGAKSITILSAIIFFVNIVLSLYLIPHFGLDGAIFSLIITYSIGLFFLFLKKKSLVKSNYLVKAEKKSGKKIKVCHVSSADITVKFLLLPQLKFLMAEGYDVFAVCSVGKWTEDIKRQGVKIKTIKIKRKISPFSDLVTLARLYRYFKKEKFDIVHTHTPKPGLLGQLAARMAGVPIVVDTIHGLYFDKKMSLPRKNFFVFIKKISAKFSDLIFSQNKEDIKTLIEKKIANPEIIKYLGNGVDIEKFNSERFSDEFISKKKKDLGLPESHKIIGTVGRLVEEKGYLELFSAMELVLEKIPDVFLLVVGPDDCEKKDSLNKNIVKKYGIEKNIIFLGERTDVEELYSLMDIFVLASHREGFPRSVIEAMAEKRPVVATDIRGCREAVENNITGKLVPSKNSEKLADAIIYLLQNPQEAKKLGVAARTRAEREFNEEFVFDRIKGEYDKLIMQKIK